MKKILEIADMILKSTCWSMRVPNFKPIHQNPFELELRKGAKNVYFDSRENQF